MMMLEDQIEHAITLLSQSQRTMALTGAGISTPSGIPDFRSSNSGFWENANPFEVASIYSFRQRPQDFYDWIQPLASQTINAQPNAAHYALAELEIHGPLVGLITQNVDMLHGKAGSQTVYEIHGHFREVTCLSCYTVFSSSPHLDDFIETGDIPHCTECGGILKPNVILIGEQLPVGILNEAKKQIRACDLMLVAGSSLQMAPACDIPAFAMDCGARLLIVNLEPTHMDRHADVVIQADVVDVLPKLAAYFQKI
jgi:NAD-dependent deacetylase